MFKEILFSPQVKRCEMITCKPGIYESLPHKLPNYLRHRKLRNIRKVLKPHRIIAQRPAPPLPPERKPRQHQQKTHSQRYRTKMPMNEDIEKHPQKNQEKNRLTTKAHNGIQWALRKSTIKSIWPKTRTHR